MKNDLPETAERENCEQNFRNSCTAFLRHNWAARTLCRHVSAGASVLEMGCGTGTGTNLFNSLGYRVTGLDTSSEAIQEAQRRFPQLSFKSVSTEDSVPPDTYDGIVALEVLEHIRDGARAAQQWKTSLKKGGVLILSTPNRRFNSDNPYTAPNRYHLKEFSLDELRSLFPDCSIRGISLRIFQNRFSNFWMRAFFFLFAFLLSPFEWKRSFISGADSFSRRDLLYGKMGYYFPRLSGGFLLVWKK
ncbi:MAG: class I SAM-dependent methyltransferase [Elusimicrobia bacterium]|nr:class I SAM-dependent methyltransferase [Candidatus Obscuribacterium magneticum]